MTRAPRVRLSMRGGQGRPGCLRQFPAKARKIGNLGGAAVGGAASRLNFLQVVTGTKSLALGPQDDHADAKIAGNVGQRRL